MSSSLQRCALLLQGVAPAKAAANDAAAAAKKKAADEEAAGEDDSKFDEFMVGPSATCKLFVPAPTTTPLCVSQQTPCVQGNDAGAFASAAGEYDQDDKEADAVRLMLERALLLPAWLLRGSAGAARAQTACRCGRTLMSTWTSGGATSARSG